MRTWVTVSAILLLVVGCAPQLDSGHPGWKKPDCRSSGCHVHPHTDKSPYECAGCHDSNGAPASHRPDSANPCAPCHGEMHGGPTAGFSDPTACNGCHN